MQGGATAGGVWEIGERGGKEKQRSHHPPDGGGGGGIAAGGGGGAGDFFGISRVHLRKKEEGKGPRRWFLA